MGTDRASQGKISPDAWLAHMTAQPSMSGPLHLTADSLPVGVMFTGRFGENATFVRLASQVEEAKPWRCRRPQA